MNYRIRHLNRYSYTQPVSLCHNLACLQPRDTLSQQVLTSRLVIQPFVEIVTERLDVFGNRLSKFAVEELHSELSVVAESVVEVRAAKPSVAPEIAWDAVTGVPAKTQVFLRPSPYIPAASDAMHQYADQSLVPGRPILDALTDLNRRMFEEFTYDGQFTDVDTPVEIAFNERRGVCQDFAHVMLSMCRAKGLACRYVSGYLETEPPPGMPKLMGADASHAWVSVFMPGAGWVDFDPTNGILPSERHITLAWGRDYGDVVPLKGLMTGGSQHQLVVQVDVTPAEVSF